MTTSQSLAWAAGLYEGEGTVSVSRLSTGRKQFYMRIEMTDEDVLLRFKDAVACGAVRALPPRTDPKRLHHKPTFMWQVGGRDDVRQLLAAFTPWLGSRRLQQAMKVLSEMDEYEAAKASV